MSYSNQRYQGYPYVNPIVTDAPSLDPAVASKWANLPRRVLSPSVNRPGGSGIAKNNQPSNSSKLAADPDEDENPVVYIELPEENGSDVCRSIESPCEVEPEYVQDTILYDPFENKRINEPKEDSGSDQSSVSETNSAAAPIPGSSQQRPTTLDVDRGSSSIQSPSTVTPGLPSFMQKESYVYGGHSSEGFPFSPIPVSEFPEPPPAYTAVDVTSSTPVPQEPQRPPEPPRTQVIVPTPDPVNSIGVMSYNRKYLTCHHCGTRVHTLVIKENGYMTLFIAVLIFIFFMPLLIIMYFTDCFKHKNHYCPNCNKLIGYELPLFGSQMHFVTE